MTPRVYRNPFIKDSVDAFPVSKSEVKSYISNEGSRSYYVGTAFVTYSDGTVLEEEVWRKEFALFTLVDYKFKPGGGWV